jgi:hypothetical protein
MIWESSTAAGCLTMAPIPLFLAAHKGPRTLQKSTMKAFDPVTTLRHVAASILGPEAEVRRVEAAATMGGDAAEWDGDALDYTVQFCVKDCGLRFLNVVFVDDAPVPRAAAPTNAFATILSTEKKRSEAYHWPSLYKDDKNRRVVRIIANALITAGIADPIKYGGFRSQEDANECQSIFWNLAQVAYAVVPHAAKFEARSMALPQIFISVAIDAWVNSPDPPERSVDRDKLQDHINVLAGMQAGGVLHVKFRMGTVMRQWHDASMAECRAGY